MLNGKKVFISIFIIVVYSWSQKIDISNCLDFNKAEEFNTNEFSLLKLKDSTLAELDFKMRYQSPFTKIPERPINFKKSELIKTISKLDLAILKKNMPLSSRPLSIEALSNRLEKRSGKNPFYPIKKNMEMVFKELNLNYNSPYKLYYINKNWQIQFSLLADSKSLVLFKNFEINDIDSVNLKWIENEYMQGKQNSDALKEEIEVLMSYWYPKYNTDVLDPVAIWPEASTKIKGIQNQYCNPLMVIKGNPFGKLIYQVVLLKNLKVEQKQSQSDLNNITIKTMSTTKWIDDSNQDQFLKRSKLNEIQTELFEEWLISNKNKNTLIDSKGRLHLRRGLEYLLAKDLDQQQAINPQSNNALMALVEIKNHLKENNVDFMVVPIPTKGEVYSNDLVGLNGFEHTEMAKFYLKLRENDIEVLDVYDDLIKASRSDSKNDEELFQQDDTHLSWRGFMTISNQITKRIIKQSWYNDLEKRSKPLSIIKDSTKRKGDLVEHLSLEEQQKRPTQNLRQTRFLENGKPYKPKKGSPILLMGDSHTGVFEKTDGKAAGFASHIAFATKLDVDLITSWGGGPSVYERVYKHRLKELAGPTRQVILILSARDFWNYPGKWSSIKD